MILLSAVLVGLLAGLCRAWIGKRPYRAYDLNASWLVLLAFLPQLLVFYLPSTRERFSDTTASLLFVGSLILLILFSLINIQKVAVWPILAGFGMNAIVILLNHGWMPITPEMVAKLYAAYPQFTWNIGSRLGLGKDIVLAPEQTKLWQLSDRFTLPDWINYQVAFSAGDVMIALGTIWLLWSLGGKKEDQKIGGIK